MTEPSASPRRHEPDTFNVRGILGAVVSVGLLVVVVALLMAGLQAWWSAPRPVTALPGPPPPGALGPSAGAPLDAHQLHDLRELRASERRTLESYGWVDRQAGVARIPITRAMDEMARRGLPPAVPGTPLAPPPSKHPATTGKGGSP